MPRTCCALALCLTLAGCYASHERAADAGHDSGVVDAHVPPRDAGPRDAGPPTPLPVEPDPDYGPDTPPSGYPDATEWTDPDPSAYPPDEPALIPLGEPRRIAMPGHGSLGDMDLEWNGTRWGLLYADAERTSFMALEPLGAPAGDLVDLGVGGNFHVTLAWSGGRFAVGVTTEGGELHPNFTLTVGFTDANGLRTSEWNTFAPAQHVAMARITHLDRWAVAFIDVASNLYVRELGTDASWLGEPQWLADSPPLRIQLVGLKSRAVTFAGSPESGLEGQVLRFPLASHAVTTQVLYPPTDRSWGGPETVAAAPFRDLAVVADTGGAPEGTRLTSLNPWDPSDTRSVDITLDQRPGAPGISASSRSGLVALCIPMLAGTYVDAPVELWVYLFGPELEQLGARTKVGELVNNTTLTSCTVAFSSEGILAAWWDRRSSEVWVRPMTARGR